MASFIQAIVNASTQPKQQSSSKTSIGKQLPPKPQSRKAVASPFTKADMASPSQSKAKDTMSEASQGGGDLVRRLLYDKHEILAKNKDLKDELDKVKQKYEKLRSVYEKLRQRYVKKKGSAEIPDLGVLDASILGDHHPTINIMEPVFKFSSSVDYGDMPEPLDFAMATGERSPEPATNRSRMRSSQGHTPSDAGYTTWLAVPPPASPGREDRQRTLLKENNSLRAELAAIKTQLEHAKTVHTQCATHIAKAREQLAQMRRELEKTTNSSQKSSQLKQELARTRGMLSSEYEKLLRIKDIVKDVGNKSFKEVDSTTAPPADSSEEQRARLLLQQYFNESC